MEFAPGRADTRSTKWFGKLTTLSPVERQILMTKIAMTETKDRYPFTN